MFKAKFPHIPRKISASLLWYTEKIGLWSILAVFILTNLYAKVNLTPAYWDKLITTMQFPFRLAAHLDLAQSFWKNGYSAEAKDELVYAESLKSVVPADSRVLGTSTLDPEILLDNWKNLTQNLTTQYNYWQNVVATKPDYRDAYLTLASLAYQLSRINEAKNYTVKALELDPNSVGAQKLLGILSQGN